MRALRLFLWGFAAFVLTVYSGLAFAQVTPTPYWTYTSNGIKSATAEAGCQAKIVASGSLYAFARVASTGERTASCYHFFNGSKTETFNSQFNKYFCSATTPYLDPTGQTCTATPSIDPNKCMDKNPIVRRWNYSGSGPFTAPGHFDGCVVTPVEMMVCRKSGTGSYCMWMVKRTGENYSGADAPGTGGTTEPEVKEDTPTKSPPIESPPVAGDPPGKNPCPTGTVHAGMSQTGIPMCIGTGSTPPAKAPQPKTETEKNETGADGSTTNTKTVITTNADGSTTKTVTVTVTKADGTKETSGTADTSATPSGAAGKSDGDPADDKYDLCKTNPNLSVCREGSVTGKCGEIQCVGDAVQCATLRAAAAMECRGKADEEALKASPQTTLGNSILSGADPMKAKIDEALKGTEVDLSKPGLDDTGFIGGGSCLPNKTMTVMGRSVTVEFAQLCTNIQPLRGVVMACAFILAYMIVSRSVLQG